MSYLYVCMCAWELLSDVHVHYILSFLIKGYLRVYMLFIGVAECLCTFGLAAGPCTHIVSVCYDAVNNVIFQCTCSCIVCAIAIQ